MRLVGKLLALMLLAASVPACAQGAFDDARQNLAAGDIDSVLLSITMGAISVDTQDENGLTLLHCAARAGSRTAVLALLDRGADPAIRSKDGSTAEMLATAPDIRADLAAAARRTAAPGRAEPAVTAH